MSPHLHHPPSRGQPYFRAGSAIQAFEYPAPTEMDNLTGTASILWRGKYLIVAGLVLGIVGATLATKTAAKVYAGNRAHPGRLGHAVRWRRGPRAAAGEPGSGVDLRDADHVAQLPRAHQRPGRRRALLRRRSRTERQRVRRHPEHAEHEPDRDHGAGPVAGSGEAPRRAGFPGVRPDDREGHGEPCAPAADAAAGPDHAAHRRRSTR